MSGGTSTHEASILITDAHAAFLDARDTAPATRAGWLRSIADGLDKNADPLVTLAIQETHLSEPRLRGELKRTSFQLRLLADEITTGVHLDAVLADARRGKPEVWVHAQSMRGTQAAVLSGNAVR